MSSNFDLFQFVCVNIHIIYTGSSTNPFIDILRTYNLIQFEQWSIYHEQMDRTSRLHRTKGLLKWVIGWWFALSTTVVIFYMFYFRKIYYIKILGNVCLIRRGICIKLYLLIWTPTEDMRDYTPSTCRKPRMQAGVNLCLYWDYVGIVLCDTIMILVSSYTHLI